MLKDLQRILELEPGSRELERFKGTSFLQFWDMLGWPEKNGKKHPCYDYERDIIDALHTHKYMYVLKGTGLGVTELALRWVAWMALRNDDLSGREAFIVTGPRIDLAITLIDRMRGFFPNERFDTDKTTIILNGLKIIAMPSHALAAMRGQLPKIIILDEASFFPPSQAAEARAVSERYISKSDPWIVLISTPNQPGDLMHQILEESPSMYHKILLPYTVGLGGILTKEEVEKARKSPSFEREMNLSFTHGAGSLALPEDIDACITDFSLENYRYGDVKIGVDPAWGTGPDSSRYGIVVAGIQDSFLRVFYAQSFKALSFESAQDIIADLVDQYHPSKIYVDGANPVVIKGVKSLVGEYVDYEKLEPDSLRWARVQPVNFGTEGKDMLGRLQQMISKHILQIHPSQIELQGEIRAIQIDETGKPDKSYSSYDLTDALRCVMKGFTVG
jgi:hypothetical protein